LLRKSSELRNSRDESMSLFFLFIFSLFIHFFYFSPFGLVVNPNVFAPFKKKKGSSSSLSSFSSSLSSFSSSIIAPIEKKTEVEIKPPNFFSNTTVPKSNQATIAVPKVGLTSAESSKKGEKEKRFELIDVSKVSSETRILAKQPLERKPTDKNFPPFPEDYEIICHKTLQYSNLNKNNNKYYSLELHQGDVKAGSKYPYRVYIHYGRSCDLDKKADAGIRLIRYFPDEMSAKVRS
jgi:hypothetical protein